MDLRGLGDGLEHVVWQHEVVWIVVRPDVEPEGPQAVVAGVGSLPDPVKQASPVENGQLIGFQTKPTAQQEPTAFMDARGSD